MYNIAPPPVSTVVSPKLSAHSHQKTENQEVLTLSDLRTRSYLVNPRFRIKASTLGSRPRNARYACAGSTVFPNARSRANRPATALSYGPPASVNAPYASAVITSLQR